MIFDKKAELLKFTKTATGMFEWMPVKTVHVHMEQQSKTNLFSKIGLGAKTTLFTLRSSEICLHNALRQSGTFYFLTDIHREGPLLMEVTAARVEPVHCAVKRAADVGGRGMEPNFQPVLDIRFPAVLTEKYLGFSQGEPMASAEKTFVLVTPKAVALRENDLVSIGEETTARYAVRVCHTLDEYKNEYEVYRKAEV